MLNHEKNISKYILSILYDVRIPKEMPRELLHIEGMKKIDSTLRRLRKAIREIGLGDLSGQIEGKGYLFGVVKNLQASLRTLTWQTKRISSGDFSQRVDFLGEFSDAFNDMTNKLERAILEVKEARDLFQMFFETIPDPTMIISTEDWRILDCNRAFEGMTGCPKKELYSKSIKEICFFKDCSQKDIFSNSIGVNTKIDNILIELEFQDKSLIYGLFSSDTIIIGKEKYILCVIKDITNRKRMEEEIRRLSETDALTQLSNRLKLDSVLELERERLLRSKSVCTIILLDIDDFKKVNDTYGHLVGDKVLKDIAKILRENTRKIDTVGRWGGEEFLIILPLTDAQGGIIMAEKLRKKISEHLFTGVGNLTASFGVAESRGEISSVELIGRADSLMYQAKNAGKNMVSVYHHKMKY